MIHRPGLRDHAHIGGLGSPLLSGLVAHWRLDELGDFLGGETTRKDQLGVTPLTDNNTVESDTGHVTATAASFFRSSSEYLSAASNDNINLAASGNGFTIALWAKRYALTNFHYLIDKGGTTNPSKEYGIYSNPTTAQAIFYMADGTNTAFAITATGFTVNVYSLIMAWWDRSSDVMSVSIDNGTPGTASTSSLTVAGGTESLKLGWMQGSAHYLDGALNSCSLWKRVLSADERSDVYNGGAGVDWPLLAA